MELDVFKKNLVNAIRGIGTWAADDKDAKEIHDDLCKALMANKSTDESQLLEYLLKKCSSQKKSDKFNDYLDELIKVIIATSRKLVQFNMKPNNAENEDQTITFNRFIENLNNIKRLRLLENETSTPESKQEKPSIPELESLKEKISNFLSKEHDPNIKKAAAEIKKLDTSDELIFLNKAMGYIYEAHCRITDTLPKKPQVQTEEITSDGNKYYTSTPVPNMTVRLFKTLRDESEPLTQAAKDILDHIELSEASIDESGYSPEERFAKLKTPCTRAEKYDLENMKQTHGQLMQVLKSADPRSTDFEKNFSAKDSFSIGYGKQ